MKLTNVTLVCTTLCVLLFSCKKNDVEKTSNNPTKKVYVAGYEESNSGQGFGRYWKDTSSHTISSIPDYIELRDIDVSGNEIYTMGEVELDAGGSKYVIWKNGISIYDFPESTFIPYEMKVIGTDIYLAGSVNGSTAPYLRPAYWKNGTISTLPQTSDYSCATSIHIDGNDVYAAGWGLTPSNTQYESKYWKNGTAYTIADSPLLNDITTSGSDVYVAGYDLSYKPAYWKNGIKISLPIITNAVGQAKKIKVSEGNIYVCGSEEMNGAPEKAMLWKNGVQQPLDGTANAYTSVNDMDIDGSTTYLCGAHYASNNQYRAVYWKNGVLNYLSNSPNMDYSEATAIRIK